MPKQFIQDDWDKNTMIKYWREDLQLFLPPDNMITSSWVREIYKEKKGWMQMSQVVQANPPR